MVEGVFCRGQLDIGVCRLPQSGVPGRGVLEAIAVFKVKIRLFKIKFSTSN